MDDAGLVSGAAGRAPIFFPSDPSRAFRGYARRVPSRLTPQLDKARATYKQLLSEATTKAEGMVTQARSRADTMLTDARTRAEALERQSREKVASLERDAARQHTEILGAIHQEKRVLEKKIDELRTFEREYSTHLKICLQSQLRELDGHESAALADPMRAPQELVTAGLPARTGNGTRN